MKRLALTMEKAIFLDRDGVINKVVLKNNKPFSPNRFEDFEFLDGVKDILQKFKEKGFLNIIITNQPDIARGRMDWETLEMMHCYTKANLPVDDIFVCPHDDIDDCCCRKPKPGLLFEAAKKCNIDLKDSFLIGDQGKDVEAGRCAGCTTILIDCPYNKKQDSDFKVSDLYSAVEIILNSCEKR